jgi:hypothetical protein
MLIFFRKSTILNYKNLLLIPVNDYYVSEFSISFKHITSRNV